MKGLTVLLMLTLPLWSYPQGVFTNQTHSALEIVLNDYPKHFRNIKGNLVNADPQTTDFASKVEIPGAINTVITRYSSSNEKEIYSWKTTLMENEDFDESAKRYKDIFSQLSNSIIKIEGEKPFILTGTYNTPTDEKRFNSSVLQLLPAASGRLANVKVELTMEYLVTEWKISILVYDEDEEAFVMD
jgi:hypothetical protein